jgi:very-short-patch-repair endonuclease
VSRGSDHYPQRAPPKRWERFRKLLAYYLACIQEDQHQEVRFAQTTRSQDYAPLDLPKEWSLLDEPSAELRFRLDALPLFSKAQLKGESAQLFYGYPILASWEPDARGEPACFLFPLFMQPVDATLGAEVTLRLVPDWPRVNREALRRLADSIEEQNDILERIGVMAWSADLPTVRLVDAVKRLGELDLELPLIEPLAPESMVSGAYTGTGQTGLLNRAMLFLGEPSRYTVNLERELRALVKVADAELDRTALAPLFAEGVTGSPERAPTQLVEVCGLNDEQRMACRSALRAPLTVVTGPPGTGKSQVVMNVLANGFLSGAFTVFSSRNRKAVSVVEERLNGIVSSPILLRLGSQARFAARLTQTLTQLLSAKSNPDDAALLAGMPESYAKAVEERDDLARRIDELREARNATDRLDRELDEWRRKLGKEDLARLEGIVEAPDVQPFDEALRLLALHEETGCSLGGLFLALRRPFDFRKAARLLQRASRAVPFVDPPPPAPIRPTSLREWVGFAKRARELVLAARALARYRASLDALLKLGYLDELSLEWNEKRHSVWTLGRKLLELHRSELGPSLTPGALGHARQLRAVTQRLMNENPGSRDAWRLRRQLQQLLPSVTQLLPAWAVTSLSAPGALPFHAGMCDLAVIDEASQCDIPSAIPMLYRARRSVIIGDPQQLRHIATLPQARESQLAARYSLKEAADEPFTFVNNSLFDLAATSPAANVVHLRDHFRSHGDIIGFSNAQWYRQDLRILTDYVALKTPGTEPPGIRWTQVASRVFRPSGGGAIAPEEAVQLVEEVVRLLGRADFSGSVGVVSPFRAQANRIRESLYQQLTPEAMERVELVADTAHGFQGDERDVIFFSPCAGAPMPSGARRFLTKTANLFNVAVTRARAQLRVVGDLGACEVSGIPHLEAFAQHYRRLQQRTETDDSVGHFERPLEEALRAAGLTPIPQYAFGRYRLDLAIVEGDLKIDIEVDGEAFHTDLDGARCKEDLTRDHYLVQRGWVVLRFWAVEIRDRLDACVERVLSVRSIPREKKALSTSGHVH